MEVLFLAHRAPWPPDKGDRLRAWAHLTRLAASGPVDLVGLADDATQAARAREGLARVCREVHVFPRSRPRALLGVLGALLGGGSLSQGWHRDGRVGRALDGLLARRDYELCWGFSSGIGAWWRAARARRKVIDLCDLDALKWEALGARRAGLRGWIDRLEARRLLPEEFALAAQADLTLLVTQAEADDFRARGGRARRLEVLTNGTPWRDFARLPPASAAPPVFGFVGQMDYPPNVEAAVELARQVLPRVRRQLPAARLVICGRAPSAAVAALARPGEVEVTGEVASVAAVLGGLAAFAAPLRSGRGLPNKVLEALAAARPVVVNAATARALGAQAGRHLVVADDAPAMAQALVELLSRPGRRDELGRAGRDDVVAHHDWEAVLDRLAALLDEVRDA